MSISLSPLVLSALQRAAAHPKGVPLLGARAGSFQASAAGKHAAQQCKEQGLLQVVRQEKRGRAVREICTVSEQGARLLLEAALVGTLSAWGDRLGDCPLPDLYMSLQTTGLPSLAPSVGRFHDALRDLHEQQRIWLHPWTGPLYEMPEPRLALLVGHEIAYYASLRR